MAQSKRQQKIDNLTAPRFDGLALSRMATEELAPILDVKGTVLDIKRRESVFNILRKTGSLTPNQAAAAVKLMWIYATMRGIRGPEEDDLRIFDKVDNSRPDVTFAAFLRARGAVYAGDEYNRIKRRIGAVSGDLLEALFYDFLECDHEPPVRNSNGVIQTRWRLKVRDYFKRYNRAVSTPNEQNLAVWVACEELSRVMT